jgi:hypothetical protein
MLEHQDFVTANLAYRREQIQRSFPAGRRAFGPSLRQRVRDARRSARNPVRGASRYELDGPLTRRPYTFDNCWVNPAPHH